jgi:regulator of extracellular matrix RemA (YlzA/DUF370 family)
MKKFFSIGKDSYIQSESVKAIVDSNSAVGQRISKLAKEKEMVYNTVSKNEKRLSVVWFFSGEVFYSALKPKTLAKRMDERGKFTLNVGPGLFLPIDHIKSFFGFGTALATKVRTSKELDKTPMSFVRKSQKRRTTIIMSDGEVISVSFSPNTVLERIGKAEKLLNGHMIETD